MKSNWKYLLCACKIFALTITIFGSTSIADINRIVAIEDRSIIEQSPIEIDKSLTLDVEEALKPIEKKANYKDKLEQHLIWTLEHRKTIFIWNYISSIVIFVMVVTIVGFGIYFSYLQFHASINTKKELSPTDFSLSKNGIKISSSIVGLFILALSLVFFYLYLDRVYPITQNRKDQTKTISEISNQISTIESKISELEKSNNK